MEVGEARAVLGVGERATADEVRAAFRRLVRAHHPDVKVGRDAGANARTARITEAYAVLRREAPVTAPAAPAPAPAPAAAAEPMSVPVEELDGDTIGLTMPGDEAFYLLLEVAHRIGDVSHVDPDDGLIETLLTFDDGRIGSLVITFQGRATGVTEAFVTLQALDGRAAPPVSWAMAKIVRTLRGATS